MVKIKPCGKYMVANEVMPTIKASDFDGRNSKCLSVWNTRRKDKIAIVLIETDPAPYPYSVMFGFTRIVFDTLKNAESFCRDHGFAKIKEE